MEVTNYSVTINKDNPFLATDSITDSSYNYYAFRMHGGENYGLFRLNDTTGSVYNTDLPDRYSDYAFSWKLCG